MTQESIVTINTKKQFNGLSEKDQNTILKELRLHDKENQKLKLLYPDCTWPFIHSSRWPAICRVVGKLVNSKLKLGLIRTWDAEEVEGHRQRTKTTSTVLDSIDLELDERWKDAEYPDVLISRFLGE